MLHWLSSEPRSERDQSEIRAEILAEITHIVCVRARMLCWLREWRKYPTVSLKKWRKSPTFSLKKWRSHLL